PDVDHINPDHRFPPPPDIERALAAIGCGLRERLPVYPEVRADWSPAARRLRAIAAPADVRLEAPGAAADAPTSERRSGLGSASSLRLPAPDDLVCTLDASREAALRAAAGRRYRPRFSLRAGEGWAERVATLDRLRTLHLSSGAFDGLVIRAEPAVPPEERLRALAYARLYLGKEWPDVGLSWADGPALALDGLSVGGSAVWDVPPVSWGWLAAELAARGLAPRRPAAVGVGGRA
ncbi:MAG: hypothetical protein HYU88_12370, partial [Chloroflexi bacterium]|nr:hypothetical protein [Chloroflexota bacterium]